MAEDIDEKPMTVRHIREVLIPAMEEVFATKKDLKVLGGGLRQEMAELETRLKQDMIDLEAGLNQRMVALEARLHEEMGEKFDKVLTGQDKIFKDLETSLIEKAVSYHQRQKEQRLWGKGNNSQSNFLMADLNGTTASRPKGQSED